MTDESNVIEMATENKEAVDPSLITDCIVYEKVEELLLSTEDDDFYTALYNLQTSVSRDIDERSRQLARLASYTLNASLPAIVVTHDLYGNINEESEIIARNKISHPLFVPGGIPIEVKIYA